MQQDVVYQDQSVDERWPVASILSCCTIITAGNTSLLRNEGIVLAVMVRVFRPVGPVPRVAEVVPVAAPVQKRMLKAAC